MKQMPKKRTKDIPKKQLYDATVRLEKQVIETLFLAQCVKEINDVLDYNIPARHKVVIVKDIIKNLRKDKKFE